MAFNNNSNLGSTLSPADLAAANKIAQSITLITGASPRIIMAASNLAGYDPETCPFGTVNDFPKLAAAPTARTAPKEASVHRKVSRQNGRLVISNSNNAPVAQSSINPTPVRRSVFERLTPVQPQQANNDDEEIIFSRDCFAQPPNAYRRKRSRNARRSFNNHIRHRQNNYATRPPNSGLPLKNSFAPLTWNSQMKFTPGASSSRQQNRGKKIMPQKQFQNHRRFNPSAQVPQSSTSYQRKFKPSPDSYGRVSIFSRLSNPSPKPAVSSQVHTYNMVGRGDGVHPMITRSKQAIPEGEVGGTSGNPNAPQEGNPLNDNLSESDSQGSQSPRDNRSVSEHDDVRVQDDPDVNQDEA